MHAQLAPERKPTAEQKGLSVAAEIILTDLRALIADLGKDGGLANGSVYDTAMVVRLAPPEEGTDAAVEWLLSQQHADGGWDNPKVLRARDMPTLAAVLALHVRGKDERARSAVERGLEFIRAQRPHWTVLPEDLLVGVEMNLPRLLDEAQALGLDVPMDQYAAVIEDGKRRREKLGRLKQLHFGTPPALTWDGWGTEPDPALVDPEGGIGPCPAATAAWVRAAQGRPELKELVAKARQYLRNAEAGTNVRLPGVVPATWRIDLMEQEWGLLALLCAGLLAHPQLADVVKPHLDTLEAAFTPRGIGFTKYFMPDGDCTAVTIAVLKAANRPVDMSALNQFKRGNHFYTYPQETHPSLTTTAHAAMALSLAGEDTSSWTRAMLELQSADGRWLIDKWQTSWLYTTTHVMLAIPEPEVMRNSIATLLRCQKKDGGWGADVRSTRLETAFAVLVLHGLRNKGVEEEAIRSALSRANGYLRRTYQPFVMSGEEDLKFLHEDPMWIGKALYHPFRMDRAFELSAMLALALEEG
ncbi:prenyltransferase/squalene oxidase repeat-containing protein [Cystobacter fuscus]|uniref:prenyltransferase/squalene oxidase repeat-containing protein n=1 Tax=Cystobacter fuscus TaxID=43 RepID=UPI0037BE9B2C